jgi:hypothetical protein
VLWEYKTLNARGGMALPDATLNTLGQQHWELVAFVRTADDRLVYIFKRVRQRSEEEFEQDLNTGSGVARSWRAELAETRRSE